MRDTDGSVAQCLQTRLHRTMGPFHPLCSWSTSGDFTLVAVQSRPTTPEKEWHAETFFSAFCQNFATWLSLITIK